MWPSSCPGTPRHAQGPPKDRPGAAQGPPRDRTGTAQGPPVGLPKAAPALLPSPGALLELSRSCPRPPQRSQSCPSAPRAGQELPWTCIHARPKLPEAVQDLTGLAQGRPSAPELSSPSCKTTSASLHSALRPKTLSKKRPSMLSRPLFDLHVQAFVPWRDSRCGTGFDPRNL